jgi:hypothetical protein
MVVKAMMQMRWASQWSIAAEALDLRWADAPTVVYLSAETLMELSLPAQWPLLTCHHLLTLIRAVYLPQELSTCLPLSGVWACTERT